MPKTVYVKCAFCGKNQRRQTRLGLTFSCKHCGERNIGPGLSKAVARLLNPAEAAPAAKPRLKPAVTSSEPPAAAAMPAPAATRIRTAAAVKSAPPKPAQKPAKAPAAAAPKPAPTPKPTPKAEPWSLKKVLYG